MKPKDKTKTITPDEKALVPMNDEERHLIETMRDKLKSKQEIIFKKFEAVVQDKENETLPYAVIMEICKASNIEGALQIVTNAAAGQHWKENDINLSVALAQIVDLEPQTPLEAMLVSQMVAVNTAIGKVMYSALLPDQTPYGKETNMALATKLQRTFLQQIEALQKLRGKGQQTVRVEHVTVNAGGQAVVGNVEHKTGGEEKK